MIAPDFSLEFAGFFPLEKSRKTREKSGAFRENSGKKYRIFPSGSLFSSETTFYPIRTNVFMYQYARPPPPGLPRQAHPHQAHPHPAHSPPPGPPPPGPPAPTLPASTRPAPACSGPLHHLRPNFQLSTKFSTLARGATGFFPRAGTGFFPSCRNSPIALIPPCCDAQNDDSC